LTNSNSNEKRVESLAVSYSSRPESATKRKVGAHDGKSRVHLLLILESYMESVQLRGKIVRWVAQSNWGIANYYVNGEAGPRKVFVHGSKVVSDEKPQMGSRIAFNVGPARSASELPAALNVEVMFTPAFTPATAVQS
jgi:hypothetical protein